MRKREDTRIIIGIYIFALAFICVIKMVVSLGTRANGSGVCRANSGDLRQQSRKAGADIARWLICVTPLYYALSIIIQNSKLFEIPKE